MPRLLPPRPDLEQLKTQARELQRAYNLGERTAQQRFAQYLPSAVSRQPLVDGRRLAPPADDRFDDATGREVLVPTLLIVGEKEDFSLNDHFNWFERRVP